MDKSRRCGASTLFSTAPGGHSFGAKAPNKRSAFARNSFVVPMGETMNRRARSFARVVLSSLLLNAGAARAQEKITAIRAGKLIDGTGAAPVPRAVILVQGKRILAAGAGLTIPQGAEDRKSTRLNSSHL